MCVATCYFALVIAVNGVTAPRESGVNCNNLGQCRTDANRSASSKQRGADLERRTDYDDDDDDDEDFNGFEEVNVIL